MPLSSFEIFLLRLPDSVNFKLFHTCDILSLIALSKTSRILGGFFAAYRQRVWDPDMHYKRWFYDVDYFKSLLRGCGAVVSGSFALQFFGRFFYPSSDMDIFLRVAGAEDMCSWLLDEGYTYAGDASQYNELGHNSLLHFPRAVMNKSSFHDPLLAVYAFHKVKKQANGVEDELRVQVIVVDTDPIQHVLFDFHSIISLVFVFDVDVTLAAVINFLTADEGYSVFPWATFVERISYVCRIRQESEARIEGWTKKYEGRGFLVSGGGSSPNPTLVRGRRFVGDKFTWRISFKGSVDRSEGYYGPPNTRVWFEVLLSDSGAVREGCCVRIAEPYVWRTIGKALKLSGAR
ncbi:LOW QUALITY PROTEIN: hypothetical protein CVT26_003944 [Gymnopilus dilepis]|uniref:Uncharacterized protein n=1 Tax=Gymnopilus dilepis TaxID=231916 RepID=A0A409WTP2_9AGAR|nr:LOW QUALITY PROTEIN: hypothetical protein CVT26_003944 [Gymnopilus dilepis]